MVDTLTAPATTPNDVVDEAEQALRTFGGNLAPGTASLLLRHWHRTHVLTLDEFVEVVARFGPVSPR